jgi:hypothetical protein
LCKVEDYAHGVNREQKEVDNIGNFEFKLHLDFDFDLDKEFTLNMGKDEEPILVRTSVNRIINSLNGLFLESGNGLPEIVDRVNQELVGLDFDVIRDEDFFIFFLPCNFRSLVFDEINEYSENNWASFKSNFDSAQGERGAEKFGYTANYVVLNFQKINGDLFGNAKLANGCSISQTHISISFERGQWFRINRNNISDIICKLAHEELLYPVINCFYIEELEFGMATIYSAEESPILIDYYDQHVNGVSSGICKNIAYNPICISGTVYVQIFSCLKPKPKRPNRPIKTHNINFSAVNFSFYGETASELSSKDHKQVEQKPNKSLNKTYNRSYKFEEYCWNLYSVTNKTMLFKDFWPSGMAAWSESGILLVCSASSVELPLTEQIEYMQEISKILKANVVEFELFRGAALQLELAIYTSWILDLQYENYKRNTLQRCHYRFKFLLGSSVLNYSIRQTPKALLRTIIEANETFDAYEDYHNDLMDDASNSSWDDINRQGLDEIRDDNPDFFLDL